MNKKINKGLSMLMLSLTALTCVGCKKTTSTEDLSITFFNGGYGEDWINNLAKRFEEAKGVKVKVTASQEGNCGAENKIKSNSGSDIYIGEGMPWKALASEGYLADLTDVYEATVETSKGAQKIKDFMDQNIVGNFYAQRKLSEPTYTPWAMPWSAKPNAMAYNEDMLKKIRHTSTIEVTPECLGQDGKWIAVPETVQDLKAFCEDVNAYNTNGDKPADDKRNYVPLGWCGKENADSVGFWIITWWAEAQGLVTSNYAGEGSFYDFFNYGNTTASHIGQVYDLNVFNQTGLKNAYNLLADFLFDDQHKYKNSIYDAYNINLKSLEQLFVANKVNEKPVLTIASSYLEKEVTQYKYIDSDQDGQPDCTFKFMNIPSLEAGAEDLLYLNFSDSIIVPARAKHLSLAKEFLVFMSSEAEVSNFSKDTMGGIRPFNCDVRETAGEFKYSTFAQSLFDVYYSSTHFYEYPANTTSYAQVSHIFRYNDPTYHASVDFLTILNHLQNPGTYNTPGDLMAAEAINAVKLNNIETWQRQYKMTDVAKIK